MQIEITAPRPQRRYTLPTFSAAAVWQSPRQEVMRAEWYRHPGSLQVHCVVTVPEFGQGYGRAAEGYNNHRASLHDALAALGLHCAPGLDACDNPPTLLSLAQALATVLRVEGDLQVIQVRPK